MKMRIYLRVVARKTTARYTTSVLHAWMSNWVRRNALRPPICGRYIWRGVPFKVEAVTQTCRGNWATRIEGVVGEKNPIAKFEITCTISPQ